MTADDDIAARLQLINTEGIGPVGFKRLLARFGSAEEALRETAAKKKVPSRQWRKKNWSVSAVSAPSFFLPPIPAIRKNCRNLTTHRRCFTLRGTPRF